MPAQLSPQANPTDVATALANPNMASLQGSQNTGYTTPTIPPPNTSSPIPTSTITNGSPLNLPPATPPADGSSLVAGTMALNPPPVTPDGSSTPATDALSGDYSQDPAYKAAQGNLDASSASLADAQGQMPSQADLLTKAQTSSGATADLARVNELQKQLDASNASFNTMFGTAGIGIGQTTGDVVGQQGAIRNAQAIQTGVIATQLATAQGKYDTAEKLAEQTATLQFSDWQNKINNIKDFITLNQNNLSQAEKLAVSKMNAQAQQQQQTLNDQKANVQLAMTQGVKTNFVNQNGKFYDARTGQVFKDIPSFLQASGVSSIQEAYQKGLVTDITGETMANIDFAKQAMAKYPDAKINSHMTQDEVANAIKQNSAIYRKETYIAPPAGSGGNGGGSTTTDSNGKAIPDTVAPYLQTTSDGTNWVDASTLQGTAAQKTKIINDAQASGYKIITNKNQAADMSNITDAQSKLDTIGTILGSITQPDAFARNLHNMGLTQFETFAQTDPQKAAAGALQSVGLDILKAISGVQGFRGNQSAIQQVTEHLPSIYDSAPVVKQKIDYVNQLINDRKNAILGTKSSGGTTVMTGPDGNQYNVPNDQVDAFVKAGGKK